MIVSDLREAILANFNGYDLTPAGVAFTAARDAILAFLTAPLPWPMYHGERLAWDIGLYQTPNEARTGFPRMRAVIQAMRGQRPQQLERERALLRRASFDRLFGHNARGALAVIDDELNR